MFAHLDADAFFASVLERMDPKIKGKPILALGAGGGVVIAASYPAKAKGIKTGMRLADARKLCPEAITRLSDFTEACRASEQIEEILRSNAALVEQMSVDEWYVDLRSIVEGIPENPHTWAAAIQKKIALSVGLTVSVGIAPTKLLAKMASEYRKPSGITIVTTDKNVHFPFPAPPKLPGSEGGSIFHFQFLRDRPAAAIPGIGRARQVHTASLNWQTAWDIAQANPQTIVHLFGKPGTDMQEELNGRPRFAVVNESPPPKSISRCRSFRNTTDMRMIFGTVMEHAAITILRMRQQGLSCRGVSVWLRDREYHYYGETIKLPERLDTEERLQSYIKTCFERIRPSCVQGCTQAGLALLELLPRGSAQYSLFEETKTVDKAEEIQRSLDEVRTRFGRGSIVRGTSLEKSSGPKKRLPSGFGRIGEVR
ncbi:MAG: DNA polymerase IV [Candidatus Peregrinibacteria bacterium]